MVSFWGNGVGRATSAGSGNWPGPTRVSIRGNKGELLKQIMSESSARNAERHQKCIGSPLPRSPGVISAPKVQSPKLAREVRDPLSLRRHCVCGFS